MKTRLIAYWILTALVAFAIGAGGVVDLIGGEQVMEGMRHLGYPDYFARILGVWKIAGAIVILLPRTALLKEWAYAGIVFDLTGASASHASVGDPMQNVLIPVVILALVVGSWLLRPASRRLTPSPV
ncbi:MAG: DoxX family protein [Clostridia bacterium]|nr:DoxX family protein [Deltaproteobacteria bacterium]